MVKKKLLLVFILIFPVFVSLLLLITAERQLYTPGLSLLSYAVLASFFMIFYHFIVLRIIFIVLALLNCLYIVFNWAKAFFFETDHLQISLIALGGTVFCTGILLIGILGGSWYGKDEEIDQNELLTKS